MTILCSHSVRADGRGQCEAPAQGGLGLTGLLWESRPETAGPGGSCHRTQQSSLTVNEDEAQKSVREGTVGARPREGWGPTDVHPRRLRSPVGVKSGRCREAAIWVSQTGARDEGLSWWVQGVS